MPDPDLATPFLQKTYDYLGNLRPLGAGEYVRNSNGSWSTEFTATVSDPSFNGGKPTVIPRLWIKNGKPVILDEDKAIDASMKSGLIFPSFKDMKEAEKFATRREKSEQSMHPLEWKPLWKQANLLGLGVP